MLPEQLELDESAFYDSSLKAFSGDENQSKLEDLIAARGVATGEGDGRMKKYIFSSPTMKNTSHPPGRESQGLLVCDLQSIKSPAIPTSLCGESLGRNLCARIENIGSIHGSSNGTLAMNT